MGDSGKNETRLASEFRRVGMSLGCEVRNVVGDLHCFGLPDKIVVTPQGRVFLVELKAGNPLTSDRVVTLLRDTKRHGPNSQRRWILAMGLRDADVFVAIGNRHSPKWALVRAAELHHEVTLEYVSLIDVWHRLLEYETT